MNDLTLNVYARPSCQMCRSVVLFLKRRGLEQHIDYRYEMMPDSILEYAQENNILYAPLVALEKDKQIVEAFGGFRPEQIDRFLERIK